MTSIVEAEPVPFERHLRVYANRSVLVRDTNDEQVFTEGQPSDPAKERLREIKQRLDSGFLEQVVEECSQANIPDIELPDEHIRLLTEVVDSVTSEHGRALVGLTVLQLTIKAILPQQSVRLHKAGKGKGFSWAEGIPMRNLDSTYITPVLRRHQLMLLNADGFMMTRSLAENYPYGVLYKAAIRGARKPWADITELLEDGNLDPLAALRYTIILLQNRSAQFESLAKQTLDHLSRCLATQPDLPAVSAIIDSHIRQSSYSARLLEVSMHSVFQALHEANMLEDYLVPLSQMRSANKKHGNIADVETTRKRGTLQIVEAWEAKYGKTYLRDELEELADKLDSHPDVRTAGFVTSDPPDLKKEVVDRLNELTEEFGVDVRIVPYAEWVREKHTLSGLQGAEFAALWLTAYGETLCQRRREIAPVDEPAQSWVKELDDLLP